jgi:hypothetical protein
MLEQLAGVASPQSITVAVTAPAPARELAPAPTASAVSSSKPDPDQPRAILFLAANPAGTDPLRIDRELRIIRDALERSRHRGNLELDIRTAATVHDLRRALLDKDYTIVHLSGHGEQAGLVLEDEHGNCVEIRREALVRLFSRHVSRGSLRCVLVNACWSLALAESLSTSVPFAIAMAGPISDVGAIEFARGFYDALGAGMDIADAHEEGMTCVDLAAPGVTFDCRLLSEELTR